jgi:hypothetical protein
LDVLITMYELSIYSNISQTTWPTMMSLCSANFAEYA